MSLNMKYWLFMMSLLAILAGFIFMGIWEAGYSDNMPFMSEQRLFLASFIGTGIISGLLFCVAYGIWDKNISWRYKLWIF